MTWEELKDKAKELGYKEVDKRYCNEETIPALVDRHGFAFYKDGTVEDVCSDRSEFHGSIFVVDRTYEQMFMIMEALK